MHKIGICHRDLKPENILIDYKKDLKIIDFGLSNLYHKNEKLRTSCGSPGYASPEMIKGEDYNGLLSDIWSIGVILYVMIVGYLPFDDPDETNLYKKIIHGEFTIPKHVSAHAKDLIAKILVTNPDKRITIKDIRNHPWYTMCSLSKIEGLFISIQPIPIDMFIIDAMKQYGYDKEQVIKLLLANKHNNITTLYYLLIKKNTKKGLSSVSDLNSSQFNTYLSKHKIKGKSPQYLILTKIDSTIMKQPSPREYHNNILIPPANTKRTNYTNNSNNTMQIVKSFNAKESDNNNNNNKSNTINYEVCHTFAGIRRNSNSRDFSGNKKANFKKLVRKRHFRNYKGNLMQPGDSKDETITNRLKKEYDVYIKKKGAIKKLKFNKGFLQTSTSFHKAERNKRNHTFTLDDHNDGSTFTVGSFIASQHTIQCTVNNNNTNNNVTNAKKLSKGNKKCFSLPKQKRIFTNQSNINMHQLYPTLITIRNRAYGTLSKGKRRLLSSEKTNNNVNNISNVMITNNNYSHIHTTNNNNNTNNNGIKAVFKNFRKTQGNVFHLKQNGLSQNKVKKDSGNKNRKKNKSVEINNIDVVVHNKSKNKKGNPFFRLKPQNRKQLQELLVHGVIHTSREYHQSRNNNNNITTSNHQFIGHSYI